MKSSGQPHWRLRRAPRKDGSYKRVKLEQRLAKSLGTILGTISVAEC
jgi:hypothetical protein